MGKTQSRFRDFWPHYLMAHRHPGCRRLHYLGSTGAAAGLIVAIVRLDPLWVIAGLAFGYAMAWIGHFAIEGNRPATFGNPLWSFLGDCRMYLLWLAGRLAPEMRAAEELLRPAPRDDARA